VYVEDKYTENNHWESSGKTLLMAFIDSFIAECLLSQKVKVTQTDLTATVQQIVKATVICVFKTKKRRFLLQ